VVGEYIPDIDSVYFIIIYLTPHEGFKTKTMDHPVSGRLVTCMRPYLDTVGAKNEDKILSRH